MTIIKTASEILPVLSTISSVMPRSASPEMSIISHIGPRYDLLECVVLSPARFADYEILESVRAANLRSPIILDHTPDVANCKK